MRLRGVVDWAGLIDKTEARAALRRRALPSIATCKTPLQPNPVRQLGSEAATRSLQAR